MSLRVKFFVVVLLAAIIPMGVVGSLAHEQIRTRTEEQYARRLDTAVTTAQRRVAERRDHDLRAVTRLCEPDFVVDRLLLDLAAERFGPAQQDDLVQQLPGVMSSLDLDALELIDSRDGRVLAAAHYPGRAGAVDATLVRAAREAGAEPFVHDVRIREAGETRQERAYLSGCFVERDRVEVLVIGGTALASLAEGLAPDAESVHVVLAGASGDLPEGVPSGREPRVVHRFPGANGSTAATLVAAIDDSGLVEQLLELRRQFAIGGAIALGIALLLSTLLAMSFTRPLAELEAAAERVGQGDLESTIGVRGGGEVASALAAFEKMRRDIRRTREKLLRAERIAAWRDIARRIAHEIKNPLSPIQVSIETMRKTYKKKHPDFDEIFEESTLTILEEVERLRRIVTEFSEFARLPRPRPETLAIEDVASHVVGLHRGGPVRVEIVETDELPQVRADREQITQVLVNLVQNAADAAHAVHGDEGGLVRLVLEPDEDRGVIVRLQDNGPGIPPEERLRVFEPYYTTKPDGKGTGLGLAIVHRIVGDHGGTVEISDSPLGGAELVVTLPKSGPPAEADGSMTDTAVPLVQRR